MKCEKCGGEWIPPKGLSVSFTNCPFCGTPLLNTETAGGYTEMSAFLEYLVSLYGSELYKDIRKLNNLISDLYRGDERMKRAYRRAMLDDTLSIKVYELSLKPINERMAFYDKLTSNFTEVNFYTQEFGKQVVDSFVKGLKLEILPPVSTEVTEEDGEWIDEFGVKYSADRKKLIKGNKNLTSYNIKEGTVVICDEAFYICRNLESLTIPSTVTRIGDDVFHGCSNLHLKVDHNFNYYVENEVLYSICLNKLVWCPPYIKELIIPSSVTSIGNCAFEDCSSLTSVIIPSSIISIGDYAFWRCFSLTDVTIPSSVTSIGEFAFFCCKSLSSVTIPSSVTSIGRSAFSGCSNLHLKVDHNFNYYVENEVLYSIFPNEIIWCPPYIKELTIPSSVTNIGNGAFCNCLSLMKVIIPSSVTNIGNGAFCNCSSLIKVIIPSSVTNIGDGAFSGCSALTNIIIPSSVTGIGNNVFMRCSSLSNITIQSSLTSIGDNVFYWCKPNTINIPKGSTDKFKKLLPSNLHQYLKETDS